MWISYFDALDATPPKMRLSLRIVLTLSLLYAPLCAQQVIIQDIDQRNYPQIRARLFAFDSSGLITPLQTTRDRLVYDNLTRQTLGVISCDQQPAPATLSAALVFDGSKRRYLGLFRAAVQAWMRFSTSGSEVALIEYGSRPYLVRDFSMRKDTLDAAARRFSLTQGNNVERSLSDSLCGAFSILSTAKYPAVSVLMCTALNTVNSDSLLSLATKARSRVYVICMGFRADSSLRKLAQLSGGMVIDNCADEKLVASFSSLAQIAAGALPCRIDWNTDSTLCSSARMAKFDIKSLATQAETPYTLNDTLRRHLRLGPKFIELGNVAAGDRRDTSFLLSALGGAVTVQRITSNNPEFEVLSTISGIRIPRNGILRVDVHFRASDDYRRYTHIVVINDACDTVDCYVAANSTPNPALNPLFESFTNFEKVYAGSMQTIRWIGLPPPDPILLEFSPDGGDHWQNVSSSATGLSFLWRVPDVKSNRCVLRAATANQLLYHYSGIFTVLQSDIKADTLNAGIVRVNQLTSASSTHALCNTSTTLLQIDSVKSDNQFVRFASVNPRAVVPGGCTDLEVHIIADRTGLLRDTLSVYSNHGVIRVPVLAQAKEISAEMPDYIQLGLVAIGVTLDTLVETSLCKTNISTLHVQNATLDFPDVDHFNLPSQNKTATLTDEDPCFTLRYQFNCTQVIRTCARVRVQTDDGEYETVAFATGMCIAPEPHYGIVVPDSIMLAVGNVAHIPIRYSPTPYAYRNMKRPFKIYLHFDNSILFPVGSTPLGTVDGVSRHLVVSGVGFENGDTLLNLHLRGAWGRTDQTVIHLDSLSWQDECPYYTNVLSGRLILTNVCKAGGLRQFVTQDSLLFRTVQPNPAREQADITFSLREKGEHRMEIVDMFGRPIREVFRQELESGEYHCVVDLHDVAPGDYYALLTTPTGRISTLIGVLR